MATENVAEVAAEQLEEVAEATRELTGRDINFALLGLGIGLIAGHFIARPYWKKKYEDISKAEVEAMREHYQQKLMALEDKPKLEEIINERGYTNQSPVAPAPVAQAEPETETDAEDSEDVEVVDGVQNVFTTSGEIVDSWDHQKELHARTPERPYVIHIDEYKENETNYNQVTYTWWENDEIMSAANDEVVDEVDRIVGLDNLKLFGHGSGQTNVVYVRNDKLNLDIEILRSDSDYAEVVHGLEVRHSEVMRRRPRQRFDDD